MKTAKLIALSLALLALMAFSVSRKPSPAAPRHSLYMEAKFQWQQFSASLSGAGMQPHRTGN